MFDQRIGMKYVTGVPGLHGRCWQGFGDHIRKEKKGKKIKVHVNTFLHPKTKQAGCLDEMMRSSSYHHGPSLLRFWVG